jgi:hypothetical protein
MLIVIILSVTILSVIKFCVIMLDVIILSVIMLAVIILIVIMLSIIMLVVIVLIVIMLHVVGLIVGAPNRTGNMKWDELANRYDRHRFHMLSKTLWQKQTGKTHPPNSYKNYF